MNRPSDGASTDQMLTERQLRAALHYAIYGNVTQAAEHAGYASRAYVSRMLREPHMAAFVSRVREGLAEAGARAAVAEDLDWSKMAPHANQLIHALLTGALRHAKVDPRLLRVELDAAREVILRAEGAVPQTVLYGELAHMMRIHNMSDEELARFQNASPEE
ncbi:MAG: hypothetical protein HY701_06645 [Gemmatimonadetes bacterium]|nr:hypothetical protein [Gemmatimonadota bacterium]